MKIQEINACKWKFRKLMLASENSENECLQVKIQKSNACKWKFRKLMLASENSGN